MLYSSQNSCLHTASLRLGPKEARSISQPGRDGVLGEPHPRSWNSVSKNKALVGCMLEGRKARPELAGWLGSALSKDNTLEVKGGTGLISKVLVHLFISTTFLNRKLEMASRKICIQSKDSFQAQTRQIIKCTKTAHFIQITRILKREAGTTNR